MTTPEASIPGLLVSTKTCDLGIRVVEECDDLLNIERSIDNAAQSNLNLLEFDERLRHQGGSSQIRKAR